MIEPTATSSNRTTFFDNGEQVFPCRCGETHRGDYGVYDFGHHNCFHTSPLVPIDSDYLVCPECGKTFDVEPREVEG